MAAAKITNNIATTRRRKDGLRKPQIKILTVLSRSKRPLTRAEIKAKISKNPNSPTAIGDALGYDNLSKVKANEIRAGFPSLMTLKYVKRLEMDIDGTREIRFEIAAAGRKALAGAK